MSSIKNAAAIQCFDLSIIFALALDCLPLLCGVTLYLQPCQCPDMLKARLLECLNETVYFDEIALAFTRMQTDVRDFLACLKQEGINLESMFPPK